MPKIVNANVYCPFPSELNPLAEEASEQTCAWLYQFGVLRNQTELDRYRRYRIPYLTSLVHPTSRLEELVQASKLLCWTRLADDLTGDMADQSCATTVLNQCASVLTVEDLCAVKPRELLHPPLVLSLQDFWHGVFPHVPLHWRQRFAQHMHDYFMAHVQELENSAQSVILDLETFVRLRLDTGFTLPLLDMIEYVDQRFLPPSVALSSQLRAIREAAGNQITWINDIYSWNKEYLAGDSHNLISVLQHYKQCSLSDAVSEACQMVTDVTEAFLAMAGRLPAYFPEYADLLRSYVTSLSWWMGHPLWYDITPRYGVTIPENSHEMPYVVRPILLAELPI